MVGAFTARLIQLDRSLIVINSWLPVSKNIVLRDNYGKSGATLAPISIPSDAAV